MDLIRKLKSVGKQAFVEHFDIFRKYASGHISREDAIETLVNLGISNEAGAAIRVGNAKIIFDAGLVIEALNLVLKAKRTPLSVPAAAKRIKGEIA
jgi:hypothetical protein